MTRINGYLGRRNLLKLAGIGGVSLAVTATTGALWSAQQAVGPQIATADQPSENPNPVRSDEALKRLLDGNKRFVDQKRQFPDQSTSRLHQTAAAQHPFATLLGCADSRVPGEIVFDQGLGDLFVVRVAGNVVNSEVMGSLEYATLILGTQLIVVMGHKRCGAVSAAVKDELLPGRISSFVEDIKPAVERVRNKPGDLIDNAVTANVQLQVELLQENSLVLSKMIKEGKLKIVGARYDLDTGIVSMIS
ncbi:carbonic anhydrase [Argonema antarcticum]|uniref:carbonic anhydrase n=1 Tax=Argonema antarcticum TaxID=2942763 RepID=UPI0020115FC7|nr:carbonic anhydrase [Argonema antarcticum]MCL1470269.1 carbonic anhydrase [Argonema antarcticum A004/B2]